MRWMWMGVLTMVVVEEPFLGVAKRDWQDVRG
jgi:hypothetical protein